MPILQWLDRSKHLKAAEAVPYRLLQAEDAHSAGDADSPNMLIQGDNLEALKALLPYYAGRVKCIFIDPPYNTLSAFEHYDDNLERSQWLAIMFPRLQLLKELLSDDGSIWVTIDDNEAHYLKVIMDEVFGRTGFESTRKYFQANVVWQKRTSPDARLSLGAAHDHILVYAKNPDRLRLNLVPLSGEKAKGFKNPDKDPRGPWASTDFTGQTGHATPCQFFTIVTPSGRKVPPPKGRCWALAEETYHKLVKDGRVWFGRTGKSKPRLKRFLAETEGMTAWTWWPNNEVGHNQEAKKEINVLFGSDAAFATPKPERLIQRVLQLATNPGDLVLDSFLGSGTTAAVAHKMGRRWIGVEMGEHAITHCAPRLKKVVEGENGGISETVGWHGGGGFRFYKIGPAAFGPDGQINAGIPFTHLAAHVWFSETHTALYKKATKPQLGVHNGVAFYLLYNGILGDKRPDGGNVLTAKVLSVLGTYAGPKVVYGEACRLGPEKLRAAQITFKQTPYDVKAR